MLVFRAFSILFSCVLLSACMTTQAGYSFLGEQKKLFRPGPEGGVDRVWTPDHIRSHYELYKTLSNYDSILVDPVLVSFSDSDAYDGLDPHALRTLTDAFRNIVMEELKGQYKLAQRKGERTLRLNLALTGVERPNRLLATTGTVLPVGLGLSVLSKMTTGEHTNVGSASMEAVLTDSVTGQPIFAAIDRRAGGKGFEKIIDTSSDAKDAFKWWAKRLARVFYLARNSSQYPVEK